jgi:hypothetical protein
MDTLWNGLGGFIIGIGLSAACGFRIILPFLGLGIAAANGLVRPAPEFAWVATWPALIAFGSAALLEIAAYYVPWMDNLLDSLAGPLAVAAGTVAAAAVVTDLPPFLKWALALIAGGGIAGLVQSGTTLLRGLSTASTGGAGNFLVATVELAAALIATVLSLLLPLAGFAMACIAAVWILRRLLGRRGRE